MRTVILLGLLAIAERIQIGDNRKEIYKESELKVLTFVLGAAMVMDVSEWMTIIF